MLASTLRQIRQIVREELDRALGPVLDALRAAGIGRKEVALRLVDLAPAFPAVNFSRRLAVPKAIVFHHTDTDSPQVTLQVLRDRGLSTHFEVGQDGTIYRYLDPAVATAWHAARANDMSIGIDFTHRSGAPWPEAQIRSGAALVADLARQFPIGPGIGPVQGQRTLSTLSEWLAGGIGYLRHFNVNATACPENLPIERMVPQASVASAGGGGGGPAAVVVAGLLLLAAANA